MSTRTQPAWMRCVKVGDVLRSGSGRDRVVRRTMFYPDGDLRCVFFAIKHCSWTRRPYTILGYSDLRQLRYTPTKATVSMRKRIDRQLARDIGNWMLPPEKLATTCCLAKDIP